jgi:hypothetical protein
MRPPVFTVLNSVVFLREASGMFFILAGVTALVGCIEIFSSRGAEALVVQGVSTLIAAILETWGALKMRKGSKLAFYLIGGYYLLETVLMFLFSNAAGPVLFTHLFFMAFFVRAFTKARQFLEAAATS